MEDTCTCGIPINKTNPRTHHDVSGWCIREEHTYCHDVLQGSLTSATGFHWACACPCHPEPELPYGEDGWRALQTWKNARLKLEEESL